MLRKVSFGLAGLAALGFAGQAMAGQINNQNYEVFVNITVAEEVSVWTDAAEETKTLLMNGQDGNNSATAASYIKYINNVEAQIDVTVDGTLPTPIVAGGGINFFIFGNSTPAAAVAAITANAYNPAGALVWTQASLGDTQELLNPIAAATSAVTYPIVYASASPGELPLADTFALEVLYTISATP